MDKTDIIILALTIIPAVWAGLSKGFINQIVGIVAIYFSILLSSQFTPPLGQWLSTFLKFPDNVLRIVSFILLFIIVFMILFIVGRLIQKLLKTVTGGWLDKFLGILFGLFKYTLLVGLLIIAFDALNTRVELVSKDTLSGSKLYPFMRDFMNNIFPYLKALLTKGQI